MKLLNSVLKLNIKNIGYQHVWMHESPILSFDQIEDAFQSLPSTKNGVCSTIILIKLMSNQTLFLLGTVSKWNDIHDQYGRTNLALWHGCLFEIEKDNEDSIFNFIIFVHNLLNRFKRDNELDKEIRNITGNIASNSKYASIEYVKQFAFSLTKDVDSSSNELKEPFPKVFILKSADYLIHNASNQCTRVYLGFPWENNLAFYCLITYLMKSERIKSVATGFISSPQDFDCIVSSRDISGFNYFDLSTLIKLQESNSTDVSSNSIALEKVKDKSFSSVNLPSLRRIIPVIPFPLFRILNVVKMGIWPFILIVVGYLLSLISTSNQMKLPNSYPIYNAKAIKQIQSPVDGFNKFLIDSWYFFPVLTTMINENLCPLGYITDSHITDYFRNSLNKDVFPVYILIQDIVSNENKGFYEYFNNPKTPSYSIYFRKGTTIAELDNSHSIGVLQSNRLYSSLKSFYAENPSDDSITSSLVKSEKFPGKSWIRIYVRAIK